MTSSGGVGATYNGDGVLVQRGATRYTQDLAAGLSQVLHDGTANAVYGHERLVTQQGATCTWYATDALGSVRATLDGAGAVQGTVGYDPWGTPQGDLLGAFGFTGALQDGASNLLYLRARWYDPGSGTFTTRDPFAGFPIAPLSLHPYAYVGNNPVNLTDPLGQCYPPLGWLRNLEPGNCSNLDAAIRIATHPNVAPDEYALAASYIVAFTGSHAILVVGAGILTWQAIAAAGGVVTAISQWGAAYVAAHPGAAAVAGGTAAAANFADEAAILAAALTGDPYAANDIHITQQLGAADGVLPFGDILACGVLVTRSGTPNAIFVMPDGVRRRILPSKGTFVGRTFYPDSPQLRSKYPHGVPFTVQGYPDFTRYAKVQVRIRMTGNRSADFAAVNTAAGFGPSAQDTPMGFIWHHHHDRTTMQLVPEDLHEAVKHTGGVAVIREKGPLP